jgi:hypothetical protein
MGDGRLPRMCFARTAGRVRRQVYGRTRAEASQKLTVLLSKTAAGSPLAGEAWTVRSYADHWLETVARARLRPARGRTTRTPCGCISGRVSALFGCDP